MKKTGLLALCIGWLLIAAGQDSITTFKPYTLAGNTLQMRLNTPEKPVAQLALVVFLHGAGERGNDNRFQLKHLNGWLQQCGNAGALDSVVFLAPQCPAGQKWVDVDWKDTIYHFPDTANLAMRQVLQAIDSLQKQYQIPNQQVYLIGMSMGGIGVIQLAHLNPGRFGGIACICGGVDLTNLSLKNEPIWFFHGLADKLVRPKSVKQFCSENAGKETIRFTPYEGVGHNAWDYAFKECALMPWLLSTKNVRK